MYKFFYLFIFYIQSSMAQVVNEVNIPLGEICSLQEIQNNAELMQNELITCKEKSNLAEKNQTAELLKPIDTIIQAIRTNIDPRSLDKQNLNELCENIKLIEKKSDKKLDDILISVPEKIQKDNKTFDQTWVYRISFGPGKSNHSRADLIIDSPHLSGTINDFQFDHRGSYDFYNIAENIRDPKKHFFQFLDEPSNNFIIEAQKGEKFIIGLKIYHPKFAARGSDKRFEPVVLPNPSNSNLDVDLVVEGRHEKGKRNLVDYFWYFELTKNMYNPTVYYEKLIPIVSAKRKSKFGSLKYGIGASAGVYLGYVKNYFAPNWQASDGSSKNPWTLVGYSGALLQRVTYTTPNRRFDLTLQDDLSVSTFKFNMLGGTAKIPTLFSNTYSIVLGVNIFNDGKKKKTPKLD